MSLQVHLHQRQKRIHVPQEVADNMPFQTTDPHSACFLSKKLAMFSFISDVSRPLQGGDNVTSPPQGPRLLREKVPPCPARAVRARRYANERTVT